ncbi:MAG: hypothetical protein GY762_06045, partial [Proteobacteria bacterium]|nr:hypothetical protein [Pseudomonadota bacterium]
THASFENNQIKVEFSKPIETATLTATEFIVSSAGGVQAGTISVTAGGTEGIFTPGADLSGSTVKVEVRTGVTDREGIALNFAFSKVFNSEGVEVIAQGEVYDDRSGLPLGGVSVKLVNIDGAAPEGVAPAAITTSVGQYVLAIPAGQCVLEITKEGYTTSHREVLAAAGFGATVFDARIAAVDNPDEELVLKPGGGTAVAMNAEPDKTGVRVRSYLSYPEGAVETEQAIRLTLISPQAIQGRLPAGWSPLAAVDIRFLNHTGTDNPKKKKCLLVVDRKSYWGLTDDSINF